MNKIENRIMKKILYIISFFLLSATAHAQLEFEQAARVRDDLAHLKDRVFGAHGGDHVAV